MTYIDDSLGPHEHVIARGHLAWLYRFFSALLLMAALGITGAVLAALPQPTSIGSAIAAGIVLLLGIGGFVAIMIPVWTTEIAVTNQRLVVKRGWLKRSSEELQLWSIEEVDWEQGVVDQIFGFGHLIICGTGDEDMRLPLINNALAFRKAVQQAISDAPRPGSHRSADSGGT